MDVVNVDALNEQRVLKCIMNNPKLLYEVNEEWFSSGGRDLYRALRSLHEKGVEISRNTILSETRDLRYQDAPEGIFDVQYSLEEWEYYVVLLKKDFVKRTINERVLDDLKVITDERSGDLDDKKLASLYNVISEGMNLIQGNSRSLQKISQIGQRYRGVLISRKLGEYYPYGDYLLDKMVPTGAAPGQITTIFGSTGMGKSAFTLNLFSKQINKRIPCMYVTLEMDEITTMDRLIALRQRIPMTSVLMRSTSESIESEMDTDSIIEICEQEIANLKKYEDRFFLVDLPSLSLDELEGLIADAKKRMGTDYLICSIDLWTMLHGINPKADVIEDAINRTNEIAKRQNVHIIAVVQANREADSKTVGSIENIKNLRPKSVNSIKNSAAIGERSRVVLSVFREKYYAKKLFPDDPKLEFMDDVFEVTLLKSSNSDVGKTVKYLYEGECFRLLPFKEDKEMLDGESEDVTPV